MFAAAERKIVDIALDEVQRTVEVRTCVVPLLVDVEHESAIVAALPGHPLLPGKRRREFQSCPEAPVELDLQRVVIRGETLVKQSGPRGSRILRLPPAARPDHLA